MTTEQQERRTREHEASRTIVKSPPELWAECSDAASLARHLNQSFGEIRIIRLEPESSVAWEGEHVSGTVQIEPSGWGTRVTLTALTEVESDPDEEEADAKVEETVADPDLAVASEAGPIRRRWRRLIGRRLKVEEPPAVEEEPKVRELVPPRGTNSPSFEEEAPEPSAPETSDAPDPEAILASALDSLGQAHHRPFSRA